jgi:short-subunit dehydrogenase
MLGLPLCLLLSTQAAAAAASERPWAVVTGASSGIGRALAVECARRGYSVAIAARRASELHALATEIRAGHSVDAVAIAVDLSDPSGARKLHAATRTRPVKLVFLNAGFSSIGPHEAQPLETLERMSALNMESVAVLSRLYGAQLPSGGALVFTSSLTAIVPLPNAALYGASRAFVHSLAGAIAAEVRPRGVRVRCLMPGATDTGFAAISDMERSLAFTGPLFRPLGIVQTAEAVAVAALEAACGAAGGGIDVIPGFLNRAYALAARSLLPRDLATAFAGEFFGALSPLRSAAAAVHALPVLLPGTCAVLVAVPLTAAEDVLGGAPVARGVLFLLLALVAVNIWQNGSAAHPPPSVAAIRTAADARRTLARKADFVAAWRHAPSPDRAAVAGRSFEAALCPLGVLAPASVFITHVLFGGVFGGRWLGKRFRAADVLGDNHFESGYQHAFTATVQPSWLDGRPALVLDYDIAGGSVVWGRLLGMRDELREVAPGVWLGLGSMRASGGMLNSAPFVMWERKG